MGWRFYFQLMHPEWTDAVHANLPTPGQGGGPNRGDAAGQAMKRVPRLHCPSDIEKERACGDRIFGLS